MTDTPDPEESADARRRRAEEAVRAIAEGAQPGAEAFKLSNEFTDEWTTRLAARLRRLFRRR